MPAIQMNGAGMVFTASPPRVTQQGAFTGLFPWISSITISGTKNNNGVFSVSRNNSGYSYLQLSPAPTLETMTAADTVLITPTYATT